MKTANDLLMTCPDDQITRMQLVWKAATKGDWKEAAYHLNNASFEGNSTWHDQCVDLAKAYESKPCM